MSLPQCSSSAASQDRVQSGPACWACGEQTEMSRAVYALPRAEVRTSAGLRSVPKTWVSVVRSQDGAASVNEGGDRVVAAGGLAQGEAGGVSSARVQGASLAGCAGYGFARPSALQAQADRVDRCGHPPRRRARQPARGLPRSPRSHASGATPSECPCQRRR